MQLQPTHSHTHTHTNMSQIQCVTCSLITTSTHTLTSNPVNRNAHWSTKCVLIFHKFAVRFRKGEDDDLGFFLIDI